MSRELDPRVRVVMESSLRSDGRSGQLLLAGVSVLSSAYLAAWALSSTGTSPTSLMLVSMAIVTSACAAVLLKDALDDGAVEGDTPFEVLIETTVRRKRDSLEGWTSAPSLLVMFGAMALTAVFTCLVQTHLAPPLDLVVRLGGGALTAGMALSMIWGRTVVVPRLRAELERLER